MMEKNISSEPEFLENISDTIDYDEEERPTVSHETLDDVMKRIKSHLPDKETHLKRILSVVKYLKDTSRDFTLRCKYLKVFADIAWWYALWFADDTAPSVGFPNTYKINIYADSLNANYLSEWFMPLATDDFFREISEDAAPILLRNPDDIRTLELRYAVSMSHVSSIFNNILLMDKKLIQRAQNVSVENTPLENVSVDSASSESNSVGSDNIATCDYSVD